MEKKEKELLKMLTEKGNCDSHEILNILKGFIQRVEKNNDIPALVLFANMVTDQFHVLDQNEHLIIDYAADHVAHDLLCDSWKVIHSKETFTKEEVREIYEDGQREFEIEEKVHKFLKGCYID